MPHLAPFVNLETLDLWAGTFTNDDLVYLEGMQKLADLNLEGTPVTVAGVEHLLKLGSLKTLNLKETKFDDEGLAKLQALQSLKSLNLQQTSVTDEGAAAFQQARPDVAIER